MLVVLMQLSLWKIILKALLHAAIFYATCLATQSKNKTEDFSAPHTCYTLQRVHATHNDLVRVEIKGLRGGLVQVRVNRNSPRHTQCEQIAARYVTRRNAESDFRNRCQKLSPCLLFAMLHATCLAMILVIASYVSRCNFSCNLFRNAVARQVA